MGSCSFPGLEGFGAYFLTINQLTRGLRGGTRLIMNKIANILVVGPRMGRVA